jgi:hypothetical protein
MAVFHCSVKTVSRSKGRSATGAAAYRAAEKIKDQRTGEVHDYRHKKGVEFREMVFPFGVTPADSRAQLWNAAEAAETRTNSTVAREYEVALPAELTAQERRALVLDFANHLSNSYGVACDIAVHAPGKGGDNRNYHAHILTTTRQVEQGGDLGAKTRVLDDIKTGEVGKIREAWADLVNDHLARAGHEARVDHRSYKVQGVDLQPMIHLGPKAAAMERRREHSALGDINREREAAREAAAVSRAAESVLELTVKPDLDASVQVEASPPIGRPEPGQTAAEAAAKEAARVAAEAAAHDAEMRAWARERLKKIRAEKEQIEKVLEPQEENKQEVGKASENKDRTPPGRGGGMGR